MAEEYLYIRPRDELMSKNNFRHLLDFTSR